MTFCVNTFMTTKPFRPGPVVRHAIEGVRERFRDELRRQWPHVISANLFPGYRVNQGIDLNSAKQMKDWLEQNCAGTHQMYPHVDVVCFVEEDDAVAFALWRSA